MANTKKSKSSPKPKRIRRKCSHQGCPNRVVQGGVCVTHGAKRKMCNHPGCDKAVKLAGYCSTHGPARKKCAQAGCTRVAVQGGRCLSHGARRRVCKFPGEECSKNAIVGGMCKKHYDMMRDANGLLDSFGACVPIQGASSAESQGGQFRDGYYQQPMQQQQPVVMQGYQEHVPPVTAPYPPLPPPAQQPIQQYYQPPPPMSAPQEAPPIQVTYKPPPPKKKNKHPRHQRGLSIFEEMGTVDAIINSGANQQAVVLPEPAAAPPQYGYPTPETEAASMPPPPPPRSLPPIPNVSNTRTPAPQVSFADSTTASYPPNKTVIKPPEEQYFSPTIAIFEQMIKASEVIDNPNNGGYAGLSPPKLTPRGRRHVSFHDKRPHHNPPPAPVGGEDLQRTVSHDEQVPQHRHRVSSPSDEMVQSSRCAPETPDLNAPEPMNIVSAGSHHGVSAEGQVLLPKRNDGYEHLFIPRALS